MSTSCTYLGEALTPPMTPWSYPSKNMLIRENIWMEIFNFLGDKHFQSVVYPMATNTRYSGRGIDGKPGVKP